jgi:hypothetical protein
MGGTSTSSPGASMGVAGVSAGTNGRAGFTG